MRYQSSRAEARRREARQVGKTRAGGSIPGQLGWFAADLSAVSTSVLRGDEADLYRQRHEDLPARRQPCRARAEGDHPGRLLVRLDAASVAPARLAITGDSQRTIDRQLRRANRRLEDLGRPRYRSSALAT
jgi:hypothetical protein